MHDKILIVDFGAQYTQLIARRIREINVYSEIIPYHQFKSNPNGLGDRSIKGIILSGSPWSVNDIGAPSISLADIPNEMPLLGICYGAQFIAHINGGNIAPADHREYGRAHLKFIDLEDALFKGVSLGSQVWMSHGDTITAIPEGYQILAGSASVAVAGFRQKGAPVYGIQFHPEVTHSLEGKTILQNFVYNICGCSGDWTEESFIESTIAQLRHQIGEDKVVMGLSGGVDSTVAALLLQRAIDKQLFCIFVNNGLLRKGEFEEVLQSYENMGLQILGVDASEAFLHALTGITDPELKRKAIGRTFIEVFDQEAIHIKDVKWLGQGTIYPDVIESVSVGGPSVTIKSHHNVGGLPASMKLQLTEPLRSLFKDEVRRVGRMLGMDASLLGRHPFPGPGLAVRILGEVTAERVFTLQQADKIYIDILKSSGNYDKVWQAGAIYLPVQSVGVMGDGRTYEHVICLRAVESSDGMTADWSHLPYEVLGMISNAIINQVNGINRVVYDISSKPPSTIEWE